MSIIAWLVLYAVIVIGVATANMTTLALIGYAMKHNEDK